MAAVSCIIYDLDGTLIESIEDIARAVNRVRDRFGLDALKTDEVRVFIGDGAASLIERAVFGIVDDPSMRPAQTLPKSGASLDEVHRLFASIYAEDPIVETTVKPGVEKALRYWQRQGTAQVVCTNKPQSITEDVLRILEIAPYFDLVVGRGRRDDDGSILPAKPDPALVEFILEQTGAPEDETWIVGDGVPDLELAANSGLPVIAILGGYTEPDRLTTMVKQLELAVTNMGEADELLRAKAAK